MAFMTDEQWQKYRNILNEWQQDAFQQDIIWRRNIVNISFHGEDNNIRYEDINIKGLIQYNYFRAWPINKPTTSGELDKESLLVYLNLKYLEELGYLNNDGQFNFKPDTDRFIINGITFKASGDSQAAQAKSSPVFTFIILQKEEINTSEDIY